MLYASIARVIEGVGTGMFTTAIFSILPDLFPNSVATIMVWQKGREHRKKKQIIIMLSEIQFYVTLINFCAELTNCYAVMLF